MEIRILKTELVDWRNIEPLQPANFKHIYNYKHIERSILENGFVNPFFVWESEGVIYSIDGVTRKEILSNLENVPDLLPAVFIDAKNRQDAVKILLSVFNTKENPIDLEVLTEWVNIEQVEVEVTSLNVVDIKDISDSDEFGTDFSLPDGDKAPFQQMTFTLADEQAEQIKNAIADIKQTEEYKYAETMGNENSNGNALYLIIMQWAEQRK